ncbi:hypothetical protein DLAC_10232 [Tieghemostelium lacteum]|uniref:B box-type domain-containing protein n=1 Tax=Tieghemostelium lacteum TaxID=361077 RepID=A0A151Z4X3_TIELA|nr:hypothetical protein DLAC_10232 [Tieghemostelium lacteum]|eukprot:KYQ89012.1 hypothetical protein DLAC_10232 [Tieghemostelium lacteum]
MSVCVGGNHLKNVELYCKSCKVAFCIKCMANHKAHDTVDIEAHYEEFMMKSMKIKDGVKQEISNREKSKVEKEVQYQKDVVIASEKQFELLDKVFRDLHEQLHAKQADLKRVWKSNLDENTHLHTVELSQVDQALNQLNYKLSTLSGGNLGMDEKLRVILEHSNAPPPPPPNTKPQPTNFKMVSLNDQKIQSVYTAINQMNFDETSVHDINVNSMTANFKKSGLSDTNSGGGYAYLYRHSKSKGLEKINLRDGKSSLVNGFNAFFNFPYTLIGSDEVSVAHWQSSPNQDGILYLIFNNWPHLIQFNKNTPKNPWVPKKLSISYQKIYSSISDGKGNIYMVASPTGSTDPRLSLFKLSLQTLECLFLSFIQTYDKYDMAFTSDQSNLLVTIPGLVYQFNIPSSTLTIVPYKLELNVDLVIHDKNYHVSYSPFYNSLFIITEKKQFLSYNMAVGESCLLALSSDVSTHVTESFIKNVKALHDNEHRIYYFEPSKQSYLCYDIHYQLWSVHTTDYIEPSNLYFIAPY